MPVPAALNDSFGFGGHNVVAAVPQGLDETHDGTAPPPAPRSIPATRSCASRSCSTPGRMRAAAPARRQRRRSPPAGAINGTPGDRRSAPTPRSWAARWARPAAGTSSTPSTPRCASACRCIGLWHSGGARLAEGVEALHAVGLVFQAMIRASGRVPQISVVLGPAAGGAAYGPALTDVVIMSTGGRVFVTGPDVVRTVTGENVDMESLGGPDTHGRRSGVVHVITDDEDAAIAAAQSVTSLLARQGTFDLAQIGPAHDLSALLPENPKRAYDVHPLVAVDPRRGRLPRAARQVGAEHRHRPRPAHRPHRRRDRQQPAAPGRLPGLAVGGEGGPVRAHVRRVRRPAGRAGRRARLPARRRPGVGRHRAARRQAAARVRRGGRAAGDAGDPQVLRRRLHRDELPLARRDPGVRLARRRGRGHGRVRRRRHPAPQEAGRGASPASARRCTRSWRRSTSGSPAASAGPWTSASSTS